jgi:hypothetical protein
MVVLPVIITVFVVAVPRSVVLALARVLLTLPLAGNGEHP